MHTANLKENGLLQAVHLLSGRGEDFLQNSSAKMGKILIIFRVACFNRLLRKGHCSWSLKPSVYPEMVKAKIPIFAAVLSLEPSYELPNCWLHCVREQFFVKPWWPLFRSQLTPFSLHPSPTGFQCGKQTLSRKQFANSLLPSSWDFWALEKCGAEGMQGREHGKKSSWVNSYHSNLIFDFWMNVVTCAILELPLYGYPWQTYTSKHVLKEFHTNTFTLGPWQCAGQKLCGVPTPLTQMAPDAVERWRRSCSLPCFSC